MGFTAKLKHLSVGQINQSRPNMRFSCVLLLFTNIFSTAFSISFESTPFECIGQNSPICMNGGSCFSYFRVTRGYSNLEKCVCEAGFFGPHCEYKNDMESKFVHRLRHAANRHHEKRIPK